MDDFIKFLLVVRDLGVNGLAGLAAAYYYYFRLNRDLLGGFWGATLIGTVGAILIGVITSPEVWFSRVIAWLMKPSWGDDILLTRVNLIAALIGAFLFLYILNRINHDKERRRS
ncbi:MAG: hypothetical protein KDK37_02150 [Leptospiraceae bacterium]|nr:hypothetical protein [Leptospiraceae bacterium]MCB1303045.1 hypothetical protein [Leptospiraceae bacterium]